MYKTLYRQIGIYRKAAILTPLFTALEVVMDVLIPYTTASLIDRGINAGDMHNVYLYGLIMVGMAFLSLLFGILAARHAAYASTGFAANLRGAMYRNIQTFAFSDIDKYSTSGLVTRMTTDVSNLQNAFQQVLRVTVRAPFRLVLSIVMCLVIDPRLSLIFIIAMLVLGTSLYLIISRVSRLFARVFEQYDQLNQSVQENVAGIRVVKAFVREGHEVSKFDRAALSLYELFVKAESLMALNSPIMNMVMYGCIIALSWWGAHFIVSDTLTTGELASLFTYVMSILSALMMLSMIFVMLTQSAASGRRVAEVIDERADIVNPDGALTRMTDGSVSFSHVRFDYRDIADSKHAPPDAGSRRSALYDVSFSIPSGATVGIIGGTGSGKSTLVNLISRLYDVKEGSVKVGGEDVRRYDLTTLRNAVSVVLQNNVLFAGTILDNLRWGNPQATLDDCRSACRTACADEFISQMPDGYDTLITQGGTNLSGGQRQRLCIARALLKRPKVLVLDDSTSACDNDTDARIRRALRESLPHTTKLIISQRISSIIDCERIIVMDNGCVAAFDTHEQLLLSSPIYREIDALQQHGASDFDQTDNKKGGTP